jgi:hypothetical protein
MDPQLGKKLEPKGNQPERSVAAPKIIWWALALLGILAFCVLAWALHNRGGGLPVT